MKYKVSKIYKYTEEVIVEAESDPEACDKAMYVEGERNHDDRLYDCVVIRRNVDDQLTEESR